MNRSDFVVVRDTCSGFTIAPMTSCSVSVTFKPTATGVRSATLVFYNDALDSPQSVSLTSRGR